MEMSDSVTNQQKRGKMRQAPLPTGNQAIPTKEPDWDYNRAKGRWVQSHFATCILERLKQMHAKTLNYAMLADIEQGEKEVPGKFLDGL